MSRAARVVAAVAVAAAAAVPALAAGAPADAVPRAPRAPSASTGGCRTVGGGPVGSAGPHRATVVVDTGSGPVWSACVSFDGTISGLAALELAQSVITDLDPVYDTYSGIGRAVCRLRGVGTDPPDCLGKSVDYWGYFHNGTYARGGGGSTEIHDGDVDGWRYGTGARPRAASLGTEATAAPPPTTAPPTTAAPRTPTTTAGRTGPGGGMTGSPGSPGSTTAPGGGEAPAGGEHGTTVPGSTAPGTASTTVAGGGAGGSSTTAPRKGGDATPEKVVAGALGNGESAGGTPPAGGTATAERDPSALPSILGFAAALALVAGAALVVRRRRRQLAAGLIPSPPN